MALKRASTASVLNSPRKPSAKRAKKKLNPHLPGYHLKAIPKGVLGELSKIAEELAELEDAEQQQCKIMQAVELSDLYGAIRHYAEKQLGMTMQDILKMSEITERAFINGRRKASR